MKYLDKYIEGNLTTKELEEISKNIIMNKLNSDKKRIWSKLLKEEYNIESTPPKKGFSGKKALKLISLIAASIALLLTFQIFNNSTSNYTDLVNNEIKILSIMGNPDIFQKGKQETDKLREQATMAFIEKDYKKSILFLEVVITSESAQNLDYFYLGISHLKNTPPNPEKSIEFLLKSKSLNGPKQEISWALSLAYLKIHDKKNAIKELTKIIENNTYKALEAKKIIAYLK